MAFADPLGGYSGPRAAEKAFVLRRMLSPSLQRTSLNRIATTINPRCCHNLATDYALLLSQKVRCSTSASTNQMLSVYQSHLLHIVTSISDRR